MIGEFALKCIHPAISKDPWTIEIFTAAGVKYDELAIRIIGAYYFDDFDHLTEPYIEYYEKLLMLPTDPEKSLDDRRAAIEARWKSGAAPTNDILKAVCDSWMNGECEVGYDPEGYITITFNSVYGTPSDLDALERALKQVIPAHLGIEYTFRYLRIKEIHRVLTLNEMNALRLGAFAK